MVELLRAIAVVLWNCLIPGTQSASVETQRQPQQAAHSSATCSALAAFKNCPEASGSISRSKAIR
uniref:Secreted protein n=1 Tax=Macrostomum lignano TaxID=282301 RepID=A0A1I8HVV9_9PLAT